MASSSASSSPAALPPMAPARDLVSFIDASPSPFHAVAEATRRLEAAGFARLRERDAEWRVAPGGKYFVTRSGSALVAFVVGGKWAGGAPAGSASGGAFAIAAGHTDSPCLRVKPISALTKAGYLSLGVETYGGGIWHTWFDRDLSLAGRVVVAAPGGGGGFTTRLVRVARPVCRVPTLAIHLDRSVNDGMKVNAETMLPPVLATVRASLLAIKGAGAGAGAGGASAATAAVSADAGTGDATARHHLGLVQLLASELGCAPADVRDFELCLYDTQGAAIGGLHDEFVYAPRLDNLCMTHSVVEGLIASSAGAEGAASVAASGDVRVAACFDHEEVGSNSVPGAASTMLEEVLQRLVPEPARMAAVARRSFLVSADMAHAVHPNHAGLHEENHRPAMHGGVVIKSNGNQRYATSATTAFLFRQLAARAGVPLQNFCVRQDMGCGSTIGPIVATRLGLRTVDVGVPQLSMHSCREMCGAGDVAHSLAFFTTFFRVFAAVDASLAGAEGE